MIRSLFMLAALAGSAAAETQAQQGSPSGPAVLRQAPAPSIYRFGIGRARVTALSDGTVAIDLHQLFRGTTLAQTDAALTRAYIRNPVEASINAYLIELDGRRILVDAGSGELFGAGNGGRVPEALVAAGVRPEEITDILITHVHTDHSGGLARGGRMTFPNAIIHVGKADVDFFLDPANAGRSGYDTRYWAEAARTLKPYMDAGKVVTFNNRSEILPGVIAEPRPGHTPGSAFFTFADEGQQIVFVGDIVHAGAVQFPRPDVTIVFDQDQNGARRTRRQAFEAFARARTLVAAPHLAFPGVGHIAPDGSGYRWFPVEHGDRNAGGDSLKL